MRVSTAARTGAGPSANGRSNGAGVHLPLQPVLASLPAELQKQVRQTSVGEMTVSVPLERVLSQLNTGVVKISFGELRATAPEVFASTPDCDQAEVILPLGEILPRLNPALFIRRTNQMRAEVPADIIGPFGKYGEGLVFPTESAKPEAAAPPPRAVTPAVSPAAPPPVVRKRGSTEVVRVSPRPPVAPRRNEVPVVPPPPPPAISPRAPKPAPVASAPIPVTPALQNLAASEAARKTPSAVPAPAPASPAPIPFALKSLAPEPDSQPAPVAAPTSVPEPPREVPTMPVALASLAKAWPESLRQEIAQTDLQEANVHLPVDKVELGLKHGKVTFTWRELRSWIKSAAPGGVSAHDETALDLPLEVLAPLFLARQKAAGGPQRKVAVDENIPNLFFGFPQPDAEEEAPASPPVPETGHAISKPVDTNYYVWDDSSDTVHMDASEFKRPAPSLETTFTSRCATPNEVVSRAEALEGVAGALVALPDGLMVANRIPSDLNGDTLAAFLPQIFGKVSQCTKELRMGELNNLNFTVGNVPWKIFRVNAIFFAAFGRPGEALPTAQLAALAAELDRKKTN